MKIMIILTIFVYVNMYARILKLIALKTQHWENRTPQ